MYKFIALFCLVAFAAAQQASVISQVKQIIQEVNADPCLKKAAQDVIPEIKEIAAEWKDGGLTAAQKMQAFASFASYYEAAKHCEKKNEGRFLAFNPIEAIKKLSEGKNELELWTFFFEVTGKCFQDIGAILNFVQIYEEDPSNTQQDIILAIIEAYYARGADQVCKDVPYIIRELLTNN